MYKLLLTFRYLRRKLIPVFAMLAVVLCTAMVIVVSSIMGGFLDLIRSTGHSLMGDVSIHTGGLGGIPHYQEIVEEVRKLPEVESASQVIIAYGLLKLPRDIVKGVQVYGIQADYADTTGYDEALFWNAERLDKYPVLEHRIGSPDLIEAAVEMKTPWEQVRNAAAAVPPPIVTGIEVWPGNERTKAGEYVALWPLPGEQLTLTLLPVTQSGGLDITAETRQFLAVNEINSGYVEADAHRVFIPFDLAQQMMKMQGGLRPLRDERGEIIIDPETLLPKTGDAIPSRATEIHIKAAPGVPPQVLKARVTEIYQQVVARHDDLMGAAYISTWEERQAGFLRAVENEKGLVTMLFSIISVVAVVMIGVVFYMIVLEKTRDIGILRAIGASPAGVSSIFLSFGAVVGTLGAGIGTLLAVLIVTYINQIHTWLGEGFGEAVFWFGITWACVLIGGAIGLFFDLRRGRRKPDTMPGIGVVLAALMTWPIMWLLMLLVRVRPRKGEIIGLAVGTVVGLIVSWSMLWGVNNLAARLNDSMGFQIWDKSVYLFDKIPSTVDPFEITVIVLVAIVASIIGALIPGIRAAMVDPVESLRYE